jgi:2-hydroxychromene-2-carboxylate isomerase
MIEAFNSRWKNNLDLGNIEVIEGICEKIGFDKSLAASAMDSEIYNSQLKSYTKIMREYKIFGVPTFLYKNERYWGQDRINSLYERVLNDK